MKLKAGQIVVYHPDSGCLSVTGCKREIWLGGDDKHLTPRIRTKNDLSQLVMLLAASQDLAFRELEKFKFQLVKPNRQLLEHTRRIRKGEL